MFDFLKKDNNKIGTIFAAQDGKVIDIKEVPDPVFAEKMLGEGVAIIPTEDTVYSPVNGTVVDITDSLHAYCIDSDDGLDILIHIGINTVELKGEGFKSFVKVNDKIKIGDKLGSADLAFIKSKGYDIHTPMIITNSNELKDINIVIGEEVKHGETVVIDYKK